MAKVHKRKFISKSSEANIKRRILRGNSKEVLRPLDLNKKHRLLCFLCLNEKLIGTNIQRAQFPMPSFDMEVTLPAIDKDKISKILTMSGVNYELRPFVSMTAPEKWANTPISHWPIHQLLFTSSIKLFRILPIDAHRFYFHETNEFGFSEASSSLMNRVWNHQRSVSFDSKQTSIMDTVQYQSRIRILGILLKPVYMFLFRHRHKRLMARYSIT